MPFAKKMLSPGLLVVGSGLLIAIATTLAVCCLWLLSVHRGDTDGLALATIIIGFVAAVSQHYASYAPTDIHRSLPCCPPLAWRR